MMDMLTADRTKQKKRTLFAFSDKNFGRTRECRCGESLRGSSGTSISEVVPSQQAENLAEEAKPAPKKASGVFTIKNIRGLHTRPSTEIVKCASKFKSHIQLKYKKTTVNARSLLGILMLAAEKGSKITVTSVGEDAQEAIDALTALAEVSFHMKY